MFFKKKKIAKQKPNINIILSILWGLFIFFLGFFIVWASQQFYNDFFSFEQLKTDISHPDKVSITDSKTELEIQEEKNTTYILLTGRWGWNHDAPNLTDTIILAGINTKYQTISLLSIPRDLWVEYPKSNWKGKINRIYESALPAGNKIAIDRLKTIVSEITGKQIDFYVNIDFKGFIEIVDTLWWVEVTLEKNFVDYEYPDGNLGYKTFILRKGTWTLDWEVALMYARSRHSTSDFDRSLRQQEILSSLKNKISQIWYFKDSKKILELYNIFNEYVETDLWFTDIVKIALELKSWDNNSIASFNLNDSCYEWSPDCQSWGFLYVPLREYFGGASVLLPNAATAKQPWSYWEIKKFATYIFDSPIALTLGQETIIYNASWIPLLAWNLSDELRKNGFNIPKNTHTKTLRNETFEKSVLYYNNIDKDHPSLRFLQNFLNVDFIQKPESVYTDKEIKIEIILANKNDF